MDSLSRTVGRALLRAYGFPNYPLVEIPAPFFESVSPTDEDFARICGTCGARVRYAREPRDVHAGDGPVAPDAAVSGD